jgi:hypothetical protein
LDNDTASDGALSNSSLVITKNPSSGQTIVDSNTGLVKYTPNSDFIGQDTFEYKVCSQKDANVCSTAIVKINVNGSPSPLPPDAVDDTAETDANKPVTINVIKNDTDATNHLDNSTLQIVTKPTNGTAKIDATTGQITYTPNTNYTGQDTFLYKICNKDGLCDAAKVQINVKKPMSIGTVLGAMEDKTSSLIRTGGTNAFSFILFLVGSLVGVFGIILSLVIGSKNQQK